MRNCWCITLADSLGHYDIAGQARSKMARQCSNSGMYTEAAKLLDEVDTSVLSQEGLTDYYDARSHLCGEIANYSLLPDVKAQYGAAQQQFRDSLEKVADKVWQSYFGQYKDIYMNALTMMIAPLIFFSIASSIAGFGNAADIGESELGVDSDKVIKLRPAFKDYLWGGTTWDCNNNFNTRMRSNQISPVLGVIERNYQDSIDRNSRILTIATIVFIIFSLLLVSILYYVSKQKKKLAQAKSDLTKVNEELSKTNHKLKWTNDWVTKSNKELFEMNEKLKNAKQTPERQEQ